MLDKLEAFVQRYNELNARLSDPKITSDQNLYRDLNREHSHIAPIVEKYTEYKKICGDILNNSEILESGDEELRELAKEELPELREKKAGVENELRLLLLPKDPNDDKDIILEIRAGTGGEEAALFAADLFRMYSRFAEVNKWKLEIMSSNSTGIGGYKEIIALLKGRQVYSRLKYESGTHRVQRVPKTEAGGRIHTSAATVAVLPEADEVEVEINPADLRIDVFRSSGPGGQSVNTTDSAVRVTHIPTGLVVSCQDEKSQHKNKAKALTILRARLYEKMQAEADKARADERKSMVGSGDRSERIRTYNFPQGRITDHRIGLTLYKLEQVLNGELEELIEGLVTFYQAEALKGT
ncbi:MAG: peptide chain release factor 1 [Oligoflexia bacterium]|nr:peptide chain release factor 1 [Oligoflexia bacterium]